MLKLLAVVLKVERTTLAQMSANSTRSTKVWKKKYIHFRKPPWAPLAVTKLHRVRQNGEYKEGEYEVMKERYNIFRTLRKSLYHYFKLESQKEIEINELEDGGGRVGGGERVEEVRRINEAWNEAIMQKRGGLDEEELCRVEEELEEVMRGIAARSEEVELQATATLLQAVEKRAALITEVSSLDEAIEISLNTNINHNFCIDLHGNKFNELSDGTLDNDGGGDDDGSGGGGDDGGSDNHGGETGGDSSVKVDDDDGGSKKVVSV